MSEKLLDWFGSRRERQVLENVNKHLGLTEDCVIELGRMVEAASMGTLEEKKRSYERLSAIEKEADELRRTIAENLLTKGALPLDLREDLMELVRTMDWVADWSKEAGRILDLLEFEGIPEEMKKAAKRMAGELKNCVLTLRKSINSLASDPKEALKLAYEVERIEEDIDDMYSDARRLFLTLDFSGFEMPFLILLNMFYDALEMVSDWCENTSDLVRVLVVRIASR
jgi:predicted phosphate transport protein (TIGR00153 family)